MIRRIFNILADTDVSRRTYIFRASLISIVPTLLLSVLCSLVIPEFVLPSNEPFPHIEKSVKSLLFLVLISAPWVETLFLGILLWALSVFTEKVFALSLISGVIWGILHELYSPSSGLLVFWSFVVFSICFLEWKKKSIIDAIIVTSLIHTLSNLLPALSFILLKIT